MIARSYPVIAKPTWRKPQSTGRHKLRNINQFGYHPAKPFATSAEHGLFPFPSPITPLRFGGRTVLIKRDDILSDKYPGTNVVCLSLCSRPRLTPLALAVGNKLRKLFSFIKDAQLDTNPSENRSSSRRKLITWGGNQSNSMLACAHLANDMKLDFHYITTPLSTKAKQDTAGNLFKSLELGMRVIETTQSLEKEANKSVLSLNQNCKPIHSQYAGLVN